MREDVIELKPPTRRRTPPPISTTARGGTWFPRANRPWAHYPLRIFVIWLLAVRVALLTLVRFVKILTIMF
jgi:hypothetical protein